jgi:very-short-patch-repair endonuclease
LDEATGAIERALSVRRLRAVWAETASQLEELLGPRYKGLTSDWPGIESDLDALAALDREFPNQERSFHSLLTDGIQFVLLEPAVGAVIQRTADLDKLWPGNTACRGEGMPELSRDARAFAEVAVRTDNVIEALGSFVNYPKDWDHLLDLLKAGAHLAEIEEQASAAIVARTYEIGPIFRGWATDFGQLDAMLKWTRELQALVAAPVPQELARRVIQPSDAAPYAVEAGKLTTALERFQDACAAAATRFPEAQTPWRSWTNAPFVAVQAWCDELSARADEASDWVDYRSAAADLNAAVGARVTDALRAATDDARLVPDTVLRHIYLSWLEAMYHAVPELNFAPADIVDAVKEFRELDARLPRSARERVRATCLAAYPSSTSNTNGKGELGVLGHELAKRKRRLPVRKLVAKIPNLLQRLKPVFMMSPLAVSQYLPRGLSESDTLVFDTVIFDEASQVFPEDAVPAIARGRQCVVVGDQQQLPPSSFFRKGDTDDDVLEDDEAATENQLMGVESILDVLVGMSGAGVQDVYLKVHYRSQHDALIRYSNHYFYDDRLLTYPSAFRARSGLGIRSIYLPEGRYEAGGSRTNRVEAERVVQEVFDLMQTRPPNESIGVVALSRPQADLIQELIDLRRLSDRRFDERFAEQANERFFVKNLENVQGDERDHMILSIGYGPTTATGVVPNRFGPINAEGGHRRLNVAVSRARRSMTVVHSLRPEDIHSEMQGARLLRRYLEFMRSGEASIEGATTARGEGEAESPFEEAVGRALEQRGYKIERQVGCAKYWIDIAVVSEDGSSFDLGIECDGATYHRSASARDRDRLRQEILERLGWRGRIHRVWSTAWIRNPNAELAAIERAIARARSMPRENLAKPVRTEAPAVSQTQSRAADHSVGAQRHSAVISAPSLQLPPYVVADLGAFPRYWDLRQTNPAFVAQIVKAVVETEGPVHVELVIERIREHYGLGRAGRVVREAVLAGISAAVRLRAVAWLPASGAGKGTDEFLIARPDCTIKPRGAMADGTVRKIEQISNQEIEAVIVQVVNAMVGASREETVISAARALGYARTGNHVESRMNDAVDRLLARHILKDSIGSLVVNGASGA